jgi:hypothetical protein
MHSRRDYRGASFAVWTGELTWFWRVFNSHHSGGAVGAAPSEADAVHEACIAIEEMSAPSLRFATEPFFDSVVARQACHEGWASRLDRVAEYLREFA